MCGEKITRIASKITHSADMTLDFDQTVVRIQDVINYMIDWMYSDPPRAVIWTGETRGVQKFLEGYKNFQRGTNDRGPF